MSNWIEQSSLNSSRSWCPSYFTGILVDLAHTVITGNFEFSLAEGGCFLDAMNTERFDLAYGDKEAL